ncbi:MAG: hypothetical protein FGM31_07150 [Candidatus Methylopumilus sp.]|nr:hypothetical protein [Candidatus Methylopumilus sp.]NBW60341.1 hypothetical protein [Methylophilaceae bacterium]
MYIIAIGWLYVTFVMALTEHSVVAGVMTFIFYGLFPCGILMWILGSKHRRSLKNKLGQPNRRDSQHD